MITMYNLPTQLSNVISILKKDNPNYTKDDLINAYESRLKPRGRVYDLNYEQAKRLLFVVYSVESGKGGYRQFVDGKKVKDYILKGRMPLKKRDDGFLTRGWNKGISKTVIQNDIASNHPEEFFLTRGLLDVLDKKFVGNK